MKHASVKLLPVCYRVYQAIAELNRSFEDAAHILDRLEGFNLFHRHPLQRCHLMLEEIRALTNQEMTEVMSDREMQNSAHFERLRLKLENRSVGSKIRATPVNARRSLAIGTERRPPAGSTISMRSRRTRSSTT